MVNEKREFNLTQEDFQFLAKLVNRKTGIVFADNKFEMVYSRLVRRLRILKLDNFSAYCDIFKNNENHPEINELINSLTTNLTKFFRENHHFEHLKEILNKMIEEKQTRIRIWSAGCSSGQEPYTIAMIVKEILNKHKNVDIKILATDIDTNILDEAKAGIYSENQITSLPEQYKRYFSKKDKDVYEIDKEVKNLITFNRLNLLEAWPIKNQFDVIFCRNVVIYFNKETQIKLFDSFSNHLKDEGWLYIGHSENLTNISTKFVLINQTIYRKLYG